MSTIHSTRSALLISLLTFIAILLFSTQAFAQQQPGLQFYPAVLPQSISYVNSENHHNKQVKDRSFPGHYVGLLKFTNSELGEVLEGISINFYEDGTLTYATDEEAGPSDMETVAQGVWEKNGKNIRFGATGFRANEGFCSSISTNAPPIYPTCKLVVYFEGQVSHGVLTGIAKVGATSSVTDGPNLFEIEVYFQVKKQTIEDYQEIFAP